MSATATAIETTEVGVARGIDREGRNVVVLWAKGVPFECRDFNLYQRIPSDKSKHIQEILQGLVTENPKPFSVDVIKIVDQTRKEHPGCSVAVHTTTSDGRLSVIAIKNCGAAA